MAASVLLGPDGSRACYRARMTETPGRILYALPMPGYRRTMTVLTAVVLVLLLVVGALAASALIAALSDWGFPAEEMLLIRIALGVPMAVTLGLVVIAAVLSIRLLRRVQRIRYVVSTEGVTLFPGRRGETFIPWCDIAAVEQQSAGLSRGATVLVLADGRRLIATLTNSMNALHFPPLPAHLATRAGSAPDPVLVTRDALERSRAGALS